jgi:hypothetical protein
LSGAARERVRQTRVAAVRTLHAEVARAVDPPCIVLGGFPDAPQARAIMNEIDSALWAA